MKVLFIRPWYRGTPVSNWPYPSLGIGYLSSYLQKHSDVSTTIADELLGDDYISKVDSEKPDIIAISSTTLEFERAIDIANHLKKKYALPIIIGGVHISALPHLLPASCDVGVIGEGELTFLELVRLYQRKHAFSSSGLENIKGLVYHLDKGVNFTGPREFISKLDNVPYPDRELFNMAKYLKPMGHWPHSYGCGTSIITSRGCPYRCIFCSGSQFWGKVRFHSPEYVVNEICLLKDKYKVGYINIFDDFFVGSRQRLKEIVNLINLYGINREVAFGCQIRADAIDEEILGLFQQMNMRYLGFGFESGSERILKFLKRNTITIDEHVHAIKLCRKYDIYIGSGFMVGSPYEEEKDLLKTYNFILKYPLNSSQVYFTTPLPGTELWDWAKEKNFVSERMEWERINQFCSGDNFVNMSNMKRDRLLKFKKKMERACHFGGLRTNYRSPLRFLRILISTFIKDPSCFLTLWDVALGFLNGKLRRQGSRKFELLSR